MEMPTPCRNDDHERCTSCEELTDVSVMVSDADCNWFCPECWAELAPVMKAEYDEAVARGHIDPED